MDITRNGIKNIGKKLRRLDSSRGLNREDLKILTLWRDSHGPSLNYLTKLIEIQLNQNGLSKKSYSLTQRLKRI